MQYTLRTIVLLFSLLLLSLPWPNRAEAEQAGQNPGEVDLSPPPSGPLPTAASIAPLAFLLREIGGARISVEIMIPPGSDLHTYEPTPGQVARLGGAAAFFTLNTPFEEHLLTKIPPSKEGGPLVVEVGRSAPRLPMEEYGDHKEDGGGHSHGELDPHIWLGPPQLAFMADDLLSGLIALDPWGEEYYRYNHLRLQRKIDATHAGIARRLAPFAGRTFYVYHPAFAYFAHAYSLKQKAVEIAGKSPSPRQLIKLVQQARRDGVRVIFVQPQFDAKSATAIARAIDGRVLSLDPMAEELLENLETMAENIAETL